MREDGKQGRLMKCSSGTSGDEERSLSAELQLRLRLQMLHRGDEMIQKIVPALVSSYNAHWDKERNEWVSTSMSKWKLGNRRAPHCE